MEGSRLSLASRYTNTEKENLMFQKINIFKFVIYAIFTIGVLVNAALIFANVYTQDNRNIALLIFVVAMGVLVALPAFYVGKTGWLKK